MAGGGGDEEESDDRLVDGPAARERVGDAVGDGEDVEGEDDREREEDASRRDGRRDAVQRESAEQL